MPIPSIPRTSSISLGTLCNEAVWFSKTYYIKTSKVCADSLLRWSLNRAIVAETASVNPRDGA